jgi:hypothetical protein
MQGIHMVLTQAIEKALANPEKYGGIQRQFVRMCQKYCASWNVRLAPDALIAVVACATEICGIVLNTAHANSDGKTLALADIKESYFMHTTSKGQKHAWASLIRLVRLLADDGRLFDGRPPTPEHKRRVVAFEGEREHRAGKRPRGA